MKKLIALAGTSLLLAGCASTQSAEVVTLATHDSFAISEELIAEFEETSGYQLEIVKLGDTGSLVSKLVVTKEAPIADAFYGIDNTFESVALKAGILDEAANAVNFSDVCFNYDIGWFEKAGLQPPSSWRELGDPKYKGLTVVTNPIYSSPGLAFLATTHAGFETPAEVFAYWRSLRDNQTKIAGSWEDAYFIDFTRYGGKYPIVLSYASSPAAEVNQDGTAGSAALLEECFRQTEYVGVLTNARNKSGAKALINFLLAESFQASQPEAMYVYPVNESVALPQTWSKYANQAKSTIGADLDIASAREQWLADWQDVFYN